MGTGGAGSMPGTGASWHRKLYRCPTPLGYSRPMGTVLPRVRGKTATLGYGI